HRRSGPFGPEGRSMGTVGTAIVVIEADDELRDSLVDFLGMIGYSAIGVPNGEQALALLAGGFVAPLIVCHDWIGPMTIAQLISGVRARPGAPVPILVVTDKRPDFGRLEAEAVLTTPF